MKPVAPVTRTVNERPRTALAGRNGLTAHPQDPAGHAGGDAPGRHARDHHAAGADHRTLADLHPVQEQRAEPDQAAVADPDRTLGPAGLLASTHLAGDGAALGLEYTTGDLAATAEDDLVADLDPALGMDHAVHADIAVAADPDRPDLGLDRHAAAEDRAVADLDAGRAGATPVDHAGIVDDDMVAQRDPVAVADDEIAAEDHAAAAAAEQARVEQLAQSQAERPRQTAEQHGDHLVAQELPPGCLGTHDEVGVSPDDRDVAAEQLATDIFLLVELLQGWVPTRVSPELARRWTV